MDSSKFKVFAIVSLAMILALYLGINAATAQFETVLWVFGGLTLVCCIWLGRRIWLLIPFLSAVDISLRIPGQPNTLLLAQVLVLIFAAMLFLMRRLPFRVQISELEVLIIILVLIVAQAYIRNPVGISFFGSDTVGGKNYFLFAITCLSAFVLCILRVPVSEIRAIFRISIYGGLLNFLIGIIGYLVPVVGFYTGAVYSLTTTPGQAPIDSGAASRIFFLTPLSRNLALWISSVVSPVAGLCRPLWLILIIVATVAAGLSGFRSSLMAVFTIFALGTFYRGGGGQLIIGLLGCVAAIVVLGFSNAIYPLPPNLQRALTFLPGTWDERYKLDAEESTEWRTEIWREVIFTDRWISNKVLGDGLGFSAAELEAQLNATNGQLVGISGFDSQRESILASGDYHSTAVSAVRTCGYLGLCVLIVVMFRLVVHAHRLIRRCRGTPWYPVSLFLGITPMVALINLPISATTFLQAASATLLSLSFIRLAENNIDLLLSDSSPSGTRV